MAKQWCGGAKRRWVLALTLAGMGVAGSVQAAPLSYTEGADLGGGLPATPLGALDVGVNTVTGSVANERDNFSVTLAAGLRITSVTLNVSNFNGGEGFYRETSSFPITFAAFFTGNGLRNLFSGDADGPGSPSFEAGVFVGEDVPNNASFNYVWSITVERTDSSQAPLPGSLALLALGLAGLGWTRRKK